MCFQFVCSMPKHTNKSMYSRCEEILFSFISILSKHILTLSPRKISNFRQVDLSLQILDHLYTFKNLLSKIMENPLRNCVNTFGQFPRACQDMLPLTHFENLCRFSDENNRISSITRPTFAPYFKIILKSQSRDLCFMSIHELYRQNLCYSSRSMSNMQDQNLAIFL